MSDETEVKPGPNMPEVLYGLWHARHGFYGSADLGILTYRSNADAQTSIDATVHPTEWQPVLLGVKPEWRDRALAAEKLLVAPALTEHPIGVLEELVVERDRYRNAFNLLARGIKDLTWFTVFDPEKKLWRVSDEHSIGEEIVKLRKLAGQLGKKGE